MSIEFIRTEIQRLRVQIRRQQNELETLKRANRPTGTAEELLSRMKANIVTLCAKCDSMMRQVG
jgi:hypothetical protein